MTGQQQQNALETMKKEVKKIIDQWIENKKSIFDDMPPPTPSPQALNHPPTWTANLFPKYLKKNLTREL